jgi:hypothetical protein
VLVAACCAATVLTPAAEAEAGYYNPFNSFSAPDNAQTGATQACDAGDIAIGGGMASGGGGYADGIYLNTSRPEPVTNPMGDSWTIYVDNYLGGAATMPRVYAMCDSKGKPADYTLRGGGDFDVADGTQSGGVAKCESGEVVVGGGGRSLDGFYADEIYLAMNAPWDGKDKDHVPDDGWKAVENNDEGGALVNHLHVYAVCDEKHGRSDFEYVKETARVKDSTLKNAFASCGKRPNVGGGVAASAKYEHGLYIGQSFPNVLGSGKRFWVGSVHNYDTPDDETRKFTVWAICKR